MIRIRSHTKKKLNSKSISDWKSNTSGRFFFCNEKRENFINQENININSKIFGETTLSKI